MNPALMDALFHKAVPVANRFNDVLQEADDLREEDTKVMVIAALLYAAGFAQQTGLAMESFVVLASAAHSKVVVEPIEDGEPDQTTN